MRKGLVSLAPDLPSAEGAPQAEPDSLIASRNRCLALVLSVAFFDFLTYTLLIPLLPLLILRTPYSLIDAAHGDSFRYFALGCLLSTYPLAQILGSPFMGALSDRWSRKRILLISYAGNMVAYLCCVLSILTGHVAWLFIGHAAAGLTGANVATTNALIAELSHAHKRTRRFSASAMMFGIAFISGPFLTGKLLRHVNSPFVASLLPFLIACGIALGNACLIWRFFKWKEKRISIEQAKPRLLFGDILRVLRSNRGLRRLFASVFLLYVGWHGFIKFFQVHLLQELRLDQAQFCNILSYFGFCCLVTQALFFTFYSHKMQERRIVAFFTLLLSVSILAFLAIQTLGAVIAAVTLFSISYSLISPSLTYVVSEFGSTDSHGRIMGLYQSVQACAKVLAPAMTGAVMSLFPEAPIVVSFACIAAMGFLFTLVPAASSSNSLANS